MQALLVRMAEDYLGRHTKKAMISREVAVVRTKFAQALRRLGE